METRWKATAVLWARSNKNDLDQNSGSGGENVQMGFRYVGLAEILGVEKEGEGGISVASP